MKGASSNEYSLNGALLTGSIWPSQVLTDRADKVRVLGQVAVDKDVLVWPGRFVIGVMKLPP